MRDPRLRLLALLSLLGLTIVLVWWRGPEWGVVRDAFAAVQWGWIVAAIALNLLSIVLRAAAWRVVITQAMPAPHPSFRLVFSAFNVGLLANVVLPGRVGELARVAVLSRRLPDREGVFPTLVGSVVAHRVFDLFPALVLVVWVLLAAKLPHWAITSLVIALCVGLGMLAFAVISARRHHTATLDELGSVRLLIERARFGLGVMHAPLPAAAAITLQYLAWACQLAAVWATMVAFDIHEPLAAAGLVLVLMNVATIFPLWPGNVGLVQAAVALPLVQYGVAYGHGFAFGIGLQAVEASVGIGIGLLFLAREGLSFATLRRMPERSRSVDEVVEEVLEPERAGAGLPG